MTINEIFEQSRVEGQYSRNIVFPRLRWISKTKFEEEISIKKAEFHPCLNENQSLKNRIFLGKLIPNLKNSLLSSNEEQFDSELIGSVYYSNDQIWKLKVTYVGQTIEITEGFMVLNIQDYNTYFWSYNDAFQKVNLPLYALKVSFDSSDSHYQYAGRRFKQSKNSEYSIVYYSNAWLKLENQIESVFGRIKTNLGLLMVPYENMEIGYSNFEVLCLKASPANLKILCRSAIRKYLDHSQKKIKSLCNQNERKYFIPDSLVNFLKYPSFLFIDDCMFKEEKIVHDNDEYELSIDQQNENLICKKLMGSVNFSKEWVLQKNTDCIFLHPFYTVFYCNSKKKAIKNNLTNSNNSNCILPYKFFVDWEKLTFEIKYL